MERERLFFFFKDSMNLLERERERLSEFTNKGRGRGRFLSEQGALCGT